MEQHRHIPRFWEWVCRCTRQQYVKQSQEQISWREKQNLAISYTTIQSWHLCCYFPHSKSTNDITHVACWQRQPIIKLWVDCHFIEIMIQHTWSKVQPSSLTSKTLPFFVSMNRINCCWSPLLQAVNIGESFGITQSGVNEYVQLPNRLLCSMYIAFVFNQAFGRTCVSMSTS